MEQTRVPVDLILSKLTQETEKVHMRAAKASEVLLGPLETGIAATPCEVVYREDRIKLKHYSARIKTRLKTPLLVVYALINRETMLDLQPGRSVVENFLNQGIDLYMMDWGYPTGKDRFLGIDDHVNGYMDNVVDFICERHGISQVNLMGICMGGTFSVIYAALHPHKIKNLVTTVTPTNFDTDTGLLHIWMRAIGSRSLTDAFGNVPGDLLNLAFLLLNPARLMLDKYAGFMENVHDKEFVQNFIRMEKWIFDSPDVPGAVFRQFIEDFYQKNLLIQSRLVIGGQTVDLKKVTMPLLNIYGQYDHLVPPAACEMLPRCVGSRDTENLCLKTGHIGIYVSSSCQRELAPKIAKWLTDREAPAARTAAAARRAYAPGKQVKARTVAARR